MAISIPIVFQIRPDGRSDVTLGRSTITAALGAGLTLREDGEMTRDA